MKLNTFKAAGTLITLAALLWTGYHWRATSQVQSGTPPMADPARVNSKLEVSTLLQPTSQEERATIKANAKYLLEKPKALSDRDFLIALQAVEHSDPARAVLLLKDRILAAIPGDANRKYLFGFVSRFTHPGAQRTISLWAMDRLELDLNLQELQLLSGLYFSGHPSQETFLGEWTPLIRGLKLAETRNYLVRKVMDHVTTDRENVAGELSKTFGIPASDLLLIPPITEAKLEMHP